MNLYLIVVLPPEPVLGQVWALNQEVHARTGSRNAIRLPPHITLVPPTRQPPEFETQATIALADFVREQQAFTVDLHDFAWFGNRTLYVRVVAAEALLGLHTALYAWCARHLTIIRPEARPFTPHMTLATRDLPPALVPDLQQEYAQRKYRATAEINALQLFRHNGQQWEKRQEFYLNQPPEK